MSTWKNTSKNIRVSCIIKLNYNTNIVMELVEKIREFNPLLKNERAMRPQELTSRSQVSSLSRILFQSDNP